MLLLVHTRPPVPQPSISGSHTRDAAETDDQGDPQCSNPHVCSSQEWDRLQCRVHAVAQPESNVLGSPQVIERNDRPCIAPSTDETHSLGVHNSAAGHAACCSSRKTNTDDCRPR